LAVLAALFFSSIGYRFLHEQKTVDDCLSGKHGSFDYSTMSCDVKENHVFVAYDIRHPHDGRRALVAFAAFVLSLAGYIYLRRPGAPVRIGAISNRIDA
jgi:hypothetical protein